MRIYKVYVNGVFYKKVVDPKVARLLASFYRKKMKVVTLEVEEEPSPRRIKNRIRSCAYWGGVTAATR